MKRTEVCQNCSSEFQTGAVKIQRHCQPCKRRLWRRNKGLPPLEEATPGDERRFKLPTRENKGLFGLLFDQGKMKCLKCGGIKSLEDFRVPGPIDLFSSHCHECRGGVSGPMRLTLRYATEIREYFGNKCSNPSCDRVDDGRGKQLHVDHDHVTGWVRGSLCHFCNAALGMVSDKPQKLRDLADYLEKGHRDYAEFVLRNKLR